MSAPPANSTPSKGAVPVQSPRRSFSGARIHAPATRLLALSLALCWVIQLMLGWSESGLNLTLNVQLGANFSSLVWAGELDRLVTANWLHGYWLHLILNALGLLVLGRAVEQLLGPRRLFIVYVVACIGGAAASAATHLEMPSVGASTGVAGLFGALGVILFGLRKRLPPQTARMRRSWLLVLGLQVALEILTETPLSPLPGVRIDHAGHLGGFVLGGVSCAALLLSGRSARANGSGKKRGRWVVPALLAAALLGSFSRAAARVALDDRSSFHVLLSEASSSSFPPSLQNNYAWEVATTPAASPALLQSASKLAFDALGRFEREVDIVGTDENRRAWWTQRTVIADTRATLLFRLGQTDAAIQLQRELLDPPAHIPEELQLEVRSQLARFLAVRIEGAGPILDPGFLPPSFRTSTGSLQQDGESLPGPLELLLLVSDSEQRLAGLVRVLVPAGEQLNTQHRVEGVPRGLNITVAAATSNPVPGQRGALRIEWTPMDPTVAGYPGP